MSTITFDTLKYAERLEKAGLTREQASAMAEAQKEVFAEALETQLATKSDVDRLENRIEQLELKLTIKLGAMMVVAVGAVAALVKLI
ncbi:DUF1640 domain-containing protein [Aromatoleum toluolicum]|uniref:DUF1640 domain-containing protein n=1 Tax=Aromatoleum toluolicum TaxID=90060 RepID=A0ABX1NGI9_9RHOO|nr:DUF1640 domain-containing protein [Aromatoleum toluolicum]NMF98416.1 DUF1640 domain-containing protein [Aromatoleum toluolicum]